MTFLFWNINKKPLERQIKNLVVKNDIDVLMLAESNIKTTSILDFLNENGNSYFFAPTIGCYKIFIFTKFPSRFIEPIIETNRMTVRQVKLPGLKPFLLCVVHFVSKLFSEEIDQAFECVENTNTVVEAEEKVGHSNTILVGDFNMNPFEKGVVAAHGFNAVMCKKIAMKKHRVVQGKNYPFFYNPMWNTFGDNSPPQGTFYYPSSKQVSYYWNIFDQVLIRPDMIPIFDHNSVRIIDSDGEDSLLTKEGIPDSAEHSDHLPISFKLNL